MIDSYLDLRDAHIIQVTIDTLVCLSKCPPAPARPGMAGRWGHWSGNGL